MKIFIVSLLVVTGSVFARDASAPVYAAPFPTGAGITDTTIIVDTGAFDCDSISVVNGLKITRARPTNCTISIDSTARAALGTVEILRRTTADSGITVNGRTSAFSKAVTITTPSAGGFIVRGTTTVGSNNGQIELRDSVTVTKRLGLGIAGDLSKGFIQAFNNGISYLPLTLQDNGGDLNLGSSGSTITVGGKLIGLDTTVLTLGARFPNLVHSAGQDSQLAVTTTGRVHTIPALAGGGATQGYVDTSVSNSNARTDSLWRGELPVDGVPNAVALQGWNPGGGGAPFPTRYPVDFQIQQHCSNSCEANPGTTTLFWDEYVDGDSLKLAPAADAGVHRMTIIFPSFPSIGSKNPVNPHGSDEIVLGAAGYGHGQLGFNYLIDPGSDVIHVVLESDGASSWVTESAAGFGGL